MEASRDEEQWGDEAQDGEQGGQGDHDVGDEGLDGKWDGEPDGEPEPLVGEVRDALLYGGLDDVLHDGRKDDELKNTIPHSGQNDFFLTHEIFHNKVWRKHKNLDFVMRQRESILPTVYHLQKNVKGYEYKCQFK